MKNHLMMYKLFIIIHVETCTYITYSVNALVCFQQLHFSEVVQDTSYLYKSRKNYRCLFGIWYVKKIYNWIITFSKPHFKVWTVFLKRHLNGRKKASVLAETILKIVSVKRFDIEMEWPECFASTASHQSFCNLKKRLWTTYLRFNLSEHQYIFIYTKHFIGI